MNQKIIDISNQNQLLAIFLPFAFCLHCLLIIDVIFLPISLTNSFIRNHLVCASPSGPILDSAGSTDPHFVLISTFISLAIFNFMGLDDFLFELTVSPVLQCLQLQPVRNKEGQEIERLEYLSYFETAIVHFMLFVANEASFA